MEWTATRTVHNFKRRNFILNKVYSVDQLLQFNITWILRLVSPRYEIGRWFGCLSFRNMVRGASTKFHAGIASGVFALFYSRFSFRPLATVYMPCTVRVLKEYHFLQNVWQKHDRLFCFIGVVTLIPIALASSLASKSVTHVHCTVYKQYAMRVRNGLPEAFSILPKSGWWEIDATVVRRTDTV